MTSNNGTPPFASHRSPVFHFWVRASEASVEANLAIGSVGKLFRRRRVLKRAPSCLEIASTWNREDPPLPVGFLRENDGMPSYASARRRAPSFRPKNHKGAQNFSNPTIYEIWLPSHRYLIDNPYLQNRLTP